MARIGEREARACIVSEGVRAALDAQGREVAIQSLRLKSFSLCTESNEGSIEEVFVLCDEIEYDDYTYSLSDGLEGAFVPVDGSGHYTIHATAEDVRKVLAFNCELYGGPKIWAEAQGVSRTYVIDVIKGNRDPGGKIARALGFEQAKVYVRSP